MSLLVGLDLDSSAGQALAGLAQVRRRMKPVFVDIAEHLVNTTQERFITQTDPEGNAWEKNAESTLVNFLGLRRKNYKKRGGLRIAAQRRVDAKRILTGKSGQLGKEIVYEVDAEDFSWGSNKVYAGPMQEGAKKHSFAGGKTPWGDIPAREFLGLSAADEQYVQDRVTEYLRRLARNRRRR